jgi:hypothetical protein
MFYNYYRCSIILFFFPSFLKFHRVVSLLQTYPIHELAYYHACFCIHVYFWIYLPCMRKIMWTLSFWAWLTSLNIMSSNCIHLPSNTCHYSYGWLKLHCVYIPHFLDSFTSCRALRLSPKLGNYE